LSGNPAVAGMGIIPSGVAGMTQLNIGLQTSNLYFAAGSANITTVAPHGYSNGDTVCLAISSRLTLPWYSYMPPEIPVGQAMYVVGATSTTFQLSLVRGGSPVVFAAADGRGNCHAERCFKVMSVSGDNVTIDFNSTGLTAGSGGQATYAASINMTNSFLWGTKQCAQMGTNNDQLNTLFNAHASSGFVTEGPSNFVYFGIGSCWNVLDTMYQPATPQWTSIVNYNNP
jgi:hypothetical protein